MTTLAGSPHQGTPDRRPADLPPADLLPARPHPPRTGVEAPAPSSRTRAGCAWCWP